MLPKRPDQIAPFGRLCAAAVAYSRTVEGNAKDPTPELVEAALEYARALGWAPRNETIDAMIALCRKLDDSLGEERTAIPWCIEHMEEAKSNG